MAFIKIFIIFFKIGLFTFGGGYAMLPLIEREIIETRHWITEDDFVDILAVAEMTPGPIAVNSATFVGYRIGGLGGAVAGTFGVVLPSFIIILLIVTSLYQYRYHPKVAQAFKGIRPVVIALIIFAAFKLGVKQHWNVASAGIAVVAFLMLMLFNIHPFIVIMLGAIAGVFLF